MGWLIALALLVAFSAALLHPYGRKLLLVMAAVVCLCLLGLWGLMTLQNRAVSERQAEQSAER